MLFRQVVFAHAGFTVNEPDVMASGVGMHPPTESAGHP
jgi:hypothetical protein